MSINTRKKNGHLKHDKCPDLPSPCGMVTRSIENPVLSRNSLLTAISLFTLALILFSATHWIGWKRKSAQPTSLASKSSAPMTPEGFIRLAKDALRVNQVDQARDLAQKGLKLYHQRVKLNPEDKRARASLLSIIGNTFTSSGPMDKAGEYFRQSTRADPAFALPHGNLGNLLFLKKEFAQTEKEFKTALQLSPNYPRTL